MTRDLTSAECDAVDFLRAARWLPVTALHPRTLAGLHDTGHVTVADGYVRLTAAGWALYDIEGVGA